MIKAGKNLKSVSTFCQQCQGKFWTSDPMKRQDTVKEKFGIIPNDCVDNEIGGCRCPFKQ